MTQIKDYYTSDIVKNYSSFERDLEDREVKSVRLIENINLNDNSKFFDAGCGDGAFLSSLQSVLGNKIVYVGGDYSKHRCKQAEENTSFEIHQINLESQLDFDDAEFDCIYSGEVIEHLYDPDNMITELFRVLKPGGTLILTTPNMNSWISRVLFLFGIQPLNYECSTVSSLYGYGYIKKFKRQDWPIGHVRLFNTLSIRDILEDNGFVINKIEGSSFEFIPKPLRPIDKLFNIFPTLSSGVVVSATKTLSNPPGK